MEVRDPVHGSIAIHDEEIPIIEHAFFQRLRNIKQLGFAEYIFPGATHTRYLHSIGVMYVSSQAFNKIFQNKISGADYDRLKATLRLGCLLHDIGHAPLSHSTESVMPKVSELKLPQGFVIGSDSRQATHEDYTLKSIVDSTFTDSFKLVNEKYGVKPTAVAELILGKNLDPDFFTVGGTNYFPILHQLVSSEIDCDRMDYLLRDSYFCGVSYGKHDLDWVIENLEACPIDGKAYLGISERAISTFDDFLLSRFHMFMMVYFHYRAVCLEQMLMYYFKEAVDEYVIPADIEAYQIHDDHMLMKVLRKSENRWAKRIVSNNIPKKIFESFTAKDNEKLVMIEEFLKENKIEYIKCSSSGRLSKYSGETNKFPVKVSKNHFGHREIRYSNIEEATDLFDKYSKAHQVVRIHCDFQDLAPHLQQSILGIIQA
ncbi:MAG: HD domain-containing protein [Bacteriovoracaceae bacterium]